MNSEISFYGIQGQSVEIDNKDYLLSLLSYIGHQEILTPYEINRFQLSLLELVKRQCRRYNGWDTSSIQADTAILISEGVICNIEQYLKTLSTEKAVEAIKNFTADEIYELGKKEVKQTLYKCGFMYENIMKAPLKTNNENYLLTLKKILPVYFNSYDYTFMPHIKPDIVTYPTAFFAKIEALKAIDFLKAYLRGLLIENRILNMFPSEKIEKLLYSHSNAYKDEIISIFSLVADNAAACAAGDRDIFSLNPEEIESLPENTAEILCNKLNIGEGETKNYLLQYIQSLTKRYENNKNVITVLKEEKKGEIIISLGNQMDDDKFRFMEYLLYKAKNITEKINIIKTGPGNIKDLWDILSSEGICFEEYEMIYGSLSIEEIAALYKYGEGDSEEEGKKRELLTYIKNLSENEQKYILNISESIVFKN